MVLRVPRGTRKRILHRPAEAPLACLWDPQASGIHSNERVVRGDDGLLASRWSPRMLRETQEGNSLKTIGKEEGS